MGALARLSGDMGVISIWDAKLMGERDQQKSKKGKNIGSIFTIAKLNYKWLIFFSLNLRLY